MMKVKVNTLLVVISAFIFAGVISVMNMSLSDFQKKWGELSTDVELLNEYTSIHPNIELKDIHVDEVNLDKAIFNGGTFKDVSLENVSARNSKYRNVKFINCKFIKCRYWNAVFIDVEFEDCEFISTSFLGSNVINVKISNCKGLETEFDNLSGKELLIENSIFSDRSSFADNKIPLVFHNTTLSGVNMMGLIGDNALTIEGGLLDEVNFGKSHFSTVTLRRARQGEGGVKFNDMTAETITFDNVDMTRGTAIARSQVKNVIIIGGNFGTAFDGSSIDHIYLRDSNLFFMEFSEVKLPKVSITNCRLYDTGLYDGYIDEFVVYNSEFEIIAGKNFRADIVLWDNVTLNGNIDLTNAQVNDFRPTRLKRGPQLKMITTGSNMRF